MRKLTKKHTFSLKVQLMLWTGIMALALLAVISILITFYLSHFFEESRYSSLHAAEQNIKLICSSNLEFTANASMDTNIMKTVITPYTNRQRKEAMAQVALSRYKNNDLFTTEISLYIVPTGTVVTSEYETRTIAAPGYEYVQHYLDNYHTLDTINFNSNTGRVFRYNDALYVALDFPQSGDLRLGVLFSHIDINYLSQQLLNEFGGTENQLVLCGAGGEILLNTSETEIFLPDMNLPTPMTWSSNRTVYALGQIDHSTLCVVVADERTTAQLILDLIKLVTPVTLFVILFCAVIIHFMTDKIFSPLENVHASIPRFGRHDTPGDGSRAGINGIADIESSVLELVSESQEQGEILKIVSSTLTEHLVRGLLANEDHSAFYYNEMFSKANGPIKGVGNYCLIRLHPLQPNETIFPQMRTLALAEIERCRGEFPFSDFNLIYSGDLICLLEFHKLLPVLQISSFLSRLTTNISEATTSACAFSVNSSELFSRIEDTGFVYASMNQTEPVGTGKFPCTRKYFDKKLKETEPLLQSGQIEQANNFLIATIDTAFNAAATPEEQQQVLRQFLKSLLDQLEHNHIRIDAPHFSDSNQAYLSGISGEQLQQDLSTTHVLISGACAKWGAYYQKRKNKYITATLQYIDTHYADTSLSLESVAQVLGIHFNYLSRIFKAGMDENFVSYVNRCRVDKSKELLLHSELTISVIASKCGFASQQNYAKVFKKFENMTPGQYRERKGETQ